MSMRPELCVLTPFRQSHSLCGAPSALQAHRRSTPGLLLLFATVGLRPKADVRK